MQTQGTQNSYNTTRLTRFKRAFMGAALAFGLCGTASTLSANSITGYSDSSTGFGRIGVGGIWHNDTLGTQNINTFGGFINVGADGMLKRFKVSLYTRFAITGGDTQGARTYHQDLSIFPRFGFNILTENIPLYVNLIFMGNMNRTLVDKGGDIGMSMFGIGGELEGKIALGSVGAIEYGGGYIYTPSANYNFTPNNNLRLNVKGGDASTILAHIGFAFDINESMHSYIRLIGRYDMLPAAPTIAYNNVNYGDGIKSHNSFNAMVEVGLGF